MRWMVGSERAVDILRNQMRWRPRRHDAIRGQKYDRVIESLSLRWVVAVVLLCMVVACVISVQLYMPGSLRLDEAQSIWQCSHSLNGMLNTIARDVHVPLYHILLFFWMRLFGDGVIAVRALSLLFFLAAIPCMYIFARHVLARRASLLAVGIFSLSPFLTWYANEARMYTLLVFVTLLNLICFLRLLHHGKGWLLYAVTVIVGVYVHYFFVFTLLYEGVYYIFNRGKFGKMAFTKFALVASAAAIALAPWLIYVHNLGSANGTRPSLVRPTSVDLFNAYSQFIFGFHDDFVNTIILSSWPVLLLLALLAVRRMEPIAPQMQFTVLYAFFPVLLAYVVSIYVTPLFVSRYMIATTVPLAIIIAGMISWFGSRFMRTSAIMLAVGGVGLLVFQSSSKATPVKEDYESAVEYINSHAQPQDIVVVSAPFTIYPVEYYYRGQARLTTLPIWDRSSDAVMPAFEYSTLRKQVSEINKHHRYVYVILSHDQGYEETIRQHYLMRFKKIGMYDFSSGLSVLVFQVGYYTVPPLTEGVRQLPD